MEESRILIVDDEREMCKLIQKGLAKYSGFDSEIVFNATEAFSKISNNFYRVVIIDYQLPDVDGISLFEEICEAGFKSMSEAILITGFGDIDFGLLALDKGFFDYIAKPINIEDVVFRIKRAAKHAKLKERVEMLSQQIEHKHNEFIGNSPSINEIKGTINKVANEKLTVFIQGETGTGKEVIARLIHNSSNRSKHPFIPINCAALTDSLLESELFGYEKGAFTGATKRKYGIIEAADMGTIFLDEINSASDSVQSSLLRYLDSGEFRRIGSAKMLSSNTRILASSNMDLELLIRESKFRQDLFYRLKVINIMIPPLRERKEDIGILCDHFLGEFNVLYKKNIIFSKVVMRYLTNYYWPGNTRQLKNAIEAIVVLNTSGVIISKDLPQEIRKECRESGIEVSFKEQKEIVVAEFEENYLKNILIQSAGNVSKASRLCQLNRKTLIEKLKVYRISPDTYKLS